MAALTSPAALLCRCQSEFIIEHYCTFALHTFAMTDTYTVIHILSIRPREARKLYNVAQNSINVNTVKCTVPQKRDCIMHKYNSI